MRLGQNARVMRLLPLALSIFGLLACQSTVRVATDAKPTSGPPATSPPPTPAAAKPADKPPRPTTKVGCDACGGRWAVHGIAETESCICKTKDGGKACRDGAECEGNCLLAEDAKMEVVEKGPPPKGFFVGRCSDYDTTFGCFRMIATGTRAKGPAIAEDAAQHLCVD
jgi:hypothetical protein